MSDALPSEYGVNLAARGHRGHMLPEARRAHERLASLPKRIHAARTPQSRSEAAMAAAERVRSTKLLGGTQTRGVTPAVAANRAGKTIRHQILSALRNGPLTTRELRALTGTKRIAARVSELRQEGHEIAAQRRAAGMTTYVLVRLA